MNTPVVVNSHVVQQSSLERQLRSVATEWWTRPCCSCTDPRASFYHLSADSAHDTSQSICFLDQCPLTRVPVCKKVFLFLHCMSHKRLEKQHVSMETPNVYQLIHWVQMLLPKLLHPLQILQEHMHYLCLVGYLDIVIRCCYFHQMSVKSQFMRST